MEKKALLEKLHNQMISEIQDYAIILLDLDGTILSWNKGAEKIQGYKPNEILNQNFRLITALHDDNGEVIGFTKLTKELSDHDKY
jgi:PAS domain S-box-containing protein